MKVVLQLQLLQKHHVQFDQHLKPMEKVKLIYAKFHIELIRICYVKPKPHKQPHRVLLEFGKQKQSLQKEKITIENEGRHNYTEDYKNLTREFYTIF